MGSGHVSYTTLHCQQRGFALHAVRAKTADARPDRVAQVIHRKLVETYRVSQRGFQLVGIRLLPKKRLFGACLL